MCKVCSIAKLLLPLAKNPEGKRKRNYMELDKKIEEAYFAAKGRNGTTACQRFASFGNPVSRATVASHMRQMGLRSKLSRLQSNHGFLSRL